MSPMSPIDAPLRAALALALAAAVSLGLSRFSYALLLPPMRSDLAWSYTTAGAMNTVNAAGYLAGALLAPRWLARHDARRVMLIGGTAAALLLALHAVVRGNEALALAVPPFVASSAAGWPGAWLALAALAAACTAVTAVMTREIHAPPVARAERARFAWSSMAFGLAGYLCFGLGYIGYMTFIVTLLREQGLTGAAIGAFYFLLGAAVIASSWLWAGLLQRWRGGGVLALLNALLAVATLMPVVSRSTPAAFASGLLFGAVFLQVVAATTALVRHNLPAVAWPAGITAFTIIFAAGQIVGPTVVGYVADSAGGLLRGLAISAGVLALGAALASLQRPLARYAGQPRRPNNACCCSASPPAPATCAPRKRSKRRRARVAISR
jgi:predicted MFS family arabinose efflux permease